MIEVNQDQEYDEDRLRTLANHLQEGGLLSEADYACLEDAAQLLERFRELLNQWLLLTLWDDDEVEAGIVRPVEAELIDDTIWAVIPEEMEQ